jgi:hypothetical protein
VKEKKKTFNVPKEERVREEPGAYRVREAKGRTSNVQRPTSNVQLEEKTARIAEEAEAAFGPKTETKYDLEERLLEYAVRLIRLVDALPATRAGRHVADQLLRCGTSAGESR